MAGQMHSDGPRVTFHKGGNAVSAVKLQHCHSTTAAPSRPLPTINRGPSRSPNQEVRGFAHHRIYRLRHATREQVTLVTWVKTSDDFYDHPKFTEAGPLGVALWLAGMAYCNRNLTDGYLPKSKAKGLLDFDGILVVSETGDGQLIDRVADYTQARLAIVGLWHEEGHDCPVCPQPGPRHYYLHDYLEYQPSRVQVEETRAVRAAAGRKGGVAKAKQNAKQVAKQDANQSAKQNPGKSLPRPRVPSPSPSPSPSPVVDSDANQSVLQVVGSNGTDLASLARFLKFDPDALRAELATVIEDVHDDEVARVARAVLDKAPGPVRNPTAYVIAAIQNDEWAIEDIAYGFEDAS